MHNNKAETPCFYHESHICNTWTPSATQKTSYTRLSSFFALMSTSSETLKLTSHETKDNEAWKHTARLYNTKLLEYNGQSDEDDLRRRRSDLSWIQTLAKITRSNTTRNTHRPGNRIKPKTESVIASNQWPSGFWASCEGFTLCCMLTF